MCAKRADHAVEPTALAVRPLLAHWSRQPAAVAQLERSCILYNQTFEVLLTNRLSRNRRCGADCQDYESGVEFRLNIAVKNAS